jgi:hypothetical protein
MNDNLAFTDDDDGHQEEQSPLRQKFEMFKKLDQNLKEPMLLAQGSQIAAFR